MKGPLPNNILKRIAPEVRRAMGKAGLTDIEAQAKWEHETEKKLQNDMEMFCLRSNLFYLRMPMHVPTRIKKGWPDFTIFLPHRRALLMEIKTAVGTLSPDQKTLHDEYERLTGDKVLVVRSYLNFVTILNEEMERNKI